MEGWGEEERETALCSGPFHVIIELQSIRQKLAKQANHAEYTHGGVRIGGRGRREVKSGRPGRRLPFIR